MKFQKVRLYLSPQRIDRYLTATGNIKTRASGLYKANLKIAQAFHPLLGILEVVLRNKINTILSAHFIDRDWIINQKQGFMTQSPLKSSVEKSERRLTSAGIPITSGKIIADQTLGFWTDLFEVRHYKLLLGRPIQIFGNIPSGHGRSDVCNKLNKVRQFRNRINHNEPVCFNGNSIDFRYVENVYQSLIDILAWIDPELINWIKDIDSVQLKIADAKTI